jgi:hypothetical protein
VPYNQRLSFGVVGEPFASTICHTTFEAAGDGPWARAWRRRGRSASFKPRVGRTIRNTVLLLSIAALGLSIGHLIYQYVRLTEAYISAVLL